MHATNPALRVAGHPGSADYNIVANSQAGAARLIQAEYHVYSKLLKDLDLQARQGTESGKFRCASKTGKSFPALNW